VKLESWVSHHVYILIGIAVAVIIVEVFTSLSIIRCCRFIVKHTGVSLAETESHDWQNK